MRVRSIVVLVICALSLAGCDYFISSRWKYRITVTVETPEGVKTGSAVRQIEAWLQPQFPSPEMSPIVHKVTGEAVAVNLGERGVLFALIDWNSYNDVYSTIKGPGTTLSESLRFYKTIKPGTKGYLAPANYPQFVTFADTKDPMTVRRVTADALDDAFGDGVLLKDITIEITYDPVTWEIDKWLPWLPEYYSRMLDGKRFNTAGSENKVANSLTSGAFSTGR